MNDLMTMMMKPAQVFFDNEAAQNSFDMLAQISQENISRFYFQMRQEKNVHAAALKAA